MRYIGLIDDREVTRTSLKLSLRVPLLANGKEKQEWDIIDIEPFKDINEYIGWISENEISILIIDEKLNESTVVNYLGHNVVIILRDAFPELPIFCITAAKREPDLNDNYKYYNFILSKDEFQERRDEFVNLFIKSGEDFYRKYTEKKDRLSEIADFMADQNGDVSDEIKNEADDIRDFLMLTHKVDSSSAEAWLHEFSSKVKNFEDILEKINSELK
ncbi:hypothetical protein ACFFLS_11960 [Flavobacterium procerum]|uniref:Uncharacterized protein n=1 Tax=Flavobacterium procerum TaxID=1455569 RepID=A0ABV6BQP7_9FLAO